LWPPEAGSFLFNALGEARRDLVRSNARLIKKCSCEIISLAQFLNADI